jgi:hypothetical protein
MSAKPQLTFWQIWNMCFGFLGIQFGFALQNANVSRIFQTLGAEIAGVAAPPVDRAVRHPALAHRVEVGEVVRDGIQPLAVGGHAGAGDADRSEDGHQAPPLIAVFSSSHLSSIPRRPSWSILTTTPSTSILPADD